MLLATVQASLHYNPYKPCGTRVICCFSVPFHAPSAGTCSGLKLLTVHILCHPFIALSKGPLRIVVTSSRNRSIVLNIRIKDCIFRYASNVRDGRLILA